MGTWATAELQLAGDQALAYQVASCTFHILLKVLIPMHSGACNRTRCRLLKVKWHRQNCYNFCDDMPYFSHGQACFFSAVVARVAKIPLVPGAFPSAMPSSSLSELASSALPDSRVSCL